MGGCFSCFGSVTKEAVKSDSVKEVSVVNAQTHTLNRVTSGLDYCLSMFL